MRMSLARTDDGEPNHANVSSWWIYEYFEEKLSCLQALTGTVSFQGLSCSQMAYAVGELGGVPVIPPNLPEGVESLLKKCLKAKPSQRPSMSFIVKVSPRSLCIVSVTMSLIVMSYNVTVFASPTRLLNSEVQYTASLIDPH